MSYEFNTCVVVQGKTMPTFLKNLDKALQVATMIELRVDTVLDIKLSDITKLKKATKAPYIFTFRHTSEGGLYNGSLKKQSQILNRAFDLGFDYVDVSYDNPIIDKFTTKERKRLLLTYHNMKETPDIRELQSILQKMRAVKPAIIKIATLVNAEKDITTLKELLSERKSNEKMIVIGMGEKGRMTRTLFPKSGSYITFVQMKGDKAIAPGILTEDEMMNLIQNSKSKI